MKRLFTVFLAIFLCCPMITLKIGAQEDTTRSLSYDSITMYHTMVKNDILRITLTTDQKKLIKEKKKEVYQPAVVSFKNTNGDLKEYNILVKTRGNMRLKTCYFPPLRIKFSHETIEEERLKDQRKYKLVVGCKAGAAYEQLVLREYLVYKMYNLITESSFQVQLVSLDMVDSEENEKPRTTFAFLIEHEDEVAQRSDGFIIKPRSMSRKALLPDLYDKMSLFQYIVGNSDWFVLNSHNTKYIRREEPKAIIPLAYDFDFAGIVNASYAGTNEEMPIKSVQDRFFIGPCRKVGHYDSTIQFFVEKKKQLFALIEDCKHLSDRSRSHMMNYLEKSFDILENPKMIKREIKRGCDWAPAKLN